MQLKQTFLYAAVGAAIGVCAIVMHKTTNNQITAQQYQQDLNQVTRKLNSLADSVNSLTTFTLQLDKSLESRTPAMALELTDDQSSVKPAHSQGASQRPAEPAPEIGVTGSGAVSPPASPMVTAQNQTPAITDEWTLKQQETRLISSFENHYNNQNMDTAWAPHAQQALTQALGDKLFANSQIRDISCRATLCKIDTEHSNLDSELVFLQQVNGRAGFSDTESFYTREEKPGGNIVMTLYISRDGHRLPRFDTDSRVMPG